MGASDEPSWRKLRGDDSASGRRAPAGGTGDTEPSSLCPERPGGEWMRMAAPSYCPPALT